VQQRVSQQILGLKPFIAVPRLCIIQDMNETPYLAKLSRPYRIAASVVTLAGIVFIVAAMLLHPLPMLEGVVGAGGGVPCLSPSTVCGDDLTPATSARPPVPTTAPPHPSDPR